MKIAPQNLSLLLALAVAPLAAQSHTAEQITVVSHVDIKPDSYMPGASETSAKLFRAEMKAAKQEPGVVSYVVLQQVGSANHFTIVETWRDQGAYERHTAAEATVKFRQGIQPFLGSPFDERPSHPWQ